MTHVTCRLTDKNRDQLRNHNPVLIGYCAGAQGRPGGFGQTGQVGGRGDTGDTGFTGFVGAPGAQGWTGQPGQIGAAGQRGLKGVAGATGFTGKLMMMMMTHQPISQSYTHTRSHAIVEQPFVWDYPGRPVPEKTFTHSHPSCSSGQPALAGTSLQLRTEEHFVDAEFFSACMPLLTATNAFRLENKTLKFSTVLYTLSSYLVVVH